MTDSDSPQPKPAISAELAARITAARATHSGFTKAADAYLDSDGERPDYASWAFRLSSALEMLLAELDAR